MPIANPYLKAHQITTQREPRSWRGVLIVVGAILAAPIAEPILLNYAGSGSGIEQLSLRLGAFLAGLMALQTYTDIVRSPERDVISLHPLLPVFFLDAVAKRTVKKSVCWPTALAIVTIPLLYRGSFEAWFWILMILFSSWLGGIGLGYAVNLGSIWAARDQRMSSILDLVRGSNPREQAAFIYAPGVALALLGIAIAFASGGARAALSGNPVLGLLVALPIVLGGVGYWWARSLVERELIRGVAILAEIDAHWRLVTDDEDAGAVYLDWVAKNNPNLLRSLRQGWRSYRLYPNLSWGCGLLCALALWGGQVDDTIILGSAGVVTLGTLPFRLAKGDPVWLDKALVLDSRSVETSRLYTTVLYSLGIWVPIAFVSVITIEKSMFIPLMLLLGLSFVASFLGASFARRFPIQGYALYIPCALVMWGTTLRVLVW
jgi:hypothetical protein